MILEGWGKKGVEFPKHEIDPKKKLTDKEWHKKYCEAIYALYCQGSTSSSITEVEKMKELRLYGNGEQGSARYLDQLLGPSDQSTGEREGYMNIDEGVFSVAPKFKNILIGMLTDMEYSITCNGLDTITANEKEDAFWDAWFQREYGPLIDSFNKTAGLPNQKVEFVPSSFKELEAYNEMGGFQARAEVAWEKAVDYTEFLSKWPEIKEKVVEDLYDINIAMVSTEVRKVDGKLRVVYQYEDPVDVIMQYDRRTGFDKSEFQAKWVRMTIGELKSKPELIEVTEEEWRSLGNAWRNRLDNNDTNYDHLIQHGKQPYNEFEVMTLVSYYRSYDIEYRRKRKNRFGKEVVKKMDENWNWGEKSSDEKEEYITTTIHNIYQSTWVIGTNHIFDFGLMQDTIREQNRRVVFPIKVIKLPGKSIVENIKPNLDDLALEWFRYQNANAMAPPPGLAIEWGSLTNIQIDGKAKSELELIKMRLQTGYLIYSATTHRGRLNMPAGYPFSELKGGMGEALDEFIKKFEMNFSAIREATGINKLADASSPDPNAPVRTSQMAMAGTANALRPFFGKYARLKEYLASDAINRIRALIKYNKDSYKGYYNAIGRGAVKTFEVAGDMVEAELAIAAIARPDSDKKMRIMQMVEAAMAPGKNGGAGLGLDDALMIEDELDRGNVKLARFLLSIKIERIKRQEEEYRSAALEQQHKQTMELEAAKTEAAKKVAQDDIENAVEKQRRLDELELKRFEEELKLQQKYKDTPVKASQSVAA